MPKRLTDEQRGPLGARLFHLRNELGLEQTDVAKATGITVDAYRQWETGKTDMPRARHLAKAAEVLETTPLYLLTGTTGDDNALSDLRQEIALLREELSRIRPVED